MYKQSVSFVAVLFGSIMISLLCFLMGTSAVQADEPIQLGSERELFCDDWLVSSMQNCELMVHQPVRENIAIVCDAPWEGNACGYWTVLYDDQAKIYRAYCHAWGLDNGETSGHRLVITTYESLDGINWTKPNVGLFDWEGTTENNIVLNYAADGSECHDFSPYIDLNPEATPDARYKATGASMNMKGVFAYKSPDGLHWTPISPEPVYTKGAFDSQNVSFWSEIEQKYVLYYRVFSEPGYVGIRMVKRAVSDDYVHWTDEGPLLFPEGEGPIMEAQYYVNQIKPYYRAKHLYIGFPARYVDNGLIPSTKLLPEWEKREKRIAIAERLGTAVTDSVYITSRDGIHFRRSNEAFMAPGLRISDNWCYGDNYIAWHVVETDSTHDDMPRELSIYATESYSTDAVSRLRRYSLRIDGFGSVHAKNPESEMVTKPFVFDGKELSLNLSTSAAGCVRVEFLDENGTPVPGFTAEDCDYFFGDTLDWRASWQGNRDVSALAGKTVALRFKMREADLYSLKFEKE